MIDSRHRYVLDAKELCREVIAPAARSVDSEARFPHEALAALRTAGLLGWFVPRAHSGLEGNLADFCEICSALGASCTSTGLIWAMHCQQVAVLARHAHATHGEYLRRASAGALIASVTTEAGRGGELLAADAALTYDESHAFVDRAAPVVSYGEYADLFLVTMRRHATAAPHDVRVLVLDRAHAKVETKGGWDALGMRGTRSVALQIVARVPRGNIVDAEFRHLALGTMVPVGHLGWASVWFGAARGALDRLLKALRTGPDRGRRLTSDLLLSRVAKQRLRLDLLQALIRSTAHRIDLLWKENAPDPFYEDVDLNVQLNNVKIAGAKLTFEVVNDLIEIAGLSDGYLTRSATGLERVFRDLRSASLMFHDDRLLLANGRLALLEVLGLASVALVESPPGSGRDERE